jgi:hypothetical protein
MLTGIEPLHDQPSTENENAMTDEGAEANARGIRIIKNLRGSNSRRVKENCSIQTKRESASINALIAIPSQNRCMVFERITFFASFSILLPPQSWMYRKRNHDD